MQKMRKLGEYLAGSLLVGVTAGLLFLAAVTVGHAA